MIHLKEQQREILELEQSITELYQIFVDMAALVDAQGEMIDDISKNVEQATAWTGEAVKNLKVANKYTKKKRKKCCALCASCGALGAAGVAAIGMFIVLMFRLHILFFLIFYALANFLLSFILAYDFYSDPTCSFGGVHNFLSIPTINFFLISLDILFIFLHISLHPSSSHIFPSFFVFTYAISLHLIIE